MLFKSLYYSISYLQPERLQGPSGRPRPPGASWGLECLGVGAWLVGLRGLEALVMLGGLAWLAGLAGLAGLTGLAGLRGVGVGVALAELVAGVDWVGGMDWLAGAAWAAQTRGRQPCVDASYANALVGQIEAGLS